MVSGTCYLFLLDMHVCVELDQLEASVILLIPTVLVFIVPSLILVAAAAAAAAMPTHPHTRTMLTATHYCCYIDLVLVVLESTISK